MLNPNRPGRVLEWHSVSPCGTGRSPSSRRSSAAASIAPVGPGVMARAVGRTRARRDVRAFPATALRTARRSSGRIRGRSSCSPRQGSKSHQSTQCWNSVPPACLPRSRVLERSAPIFARRLLYLVSGHKPGTTSVEQSLDNLVQSCFVRSQFFSEAGEKMQRSPASLEKKSPRFNDLQSWGPKRPSHKVRRMRAQRTPFWLLSRRGSPQPCGYNPWGQREFPAVAGRGETVREGVWRRERD